MREMQVETETVSMVAPVLAAPTVKLAIIGSDPPGQLIHGR
jgi:hypothetical protein